MARSSDQRLASVLGAVAALDPVDEREERSIERLLSEVQRLEFPFDEDADPVHMTASGFVLGTRGMILHLHRRLNIWVQPGGHIDPGEEAPDGALRESMEETGLRIIHPPEGPLLFHVDCHPGPRGHTHLDLRYVRLAGARDPAPPPGESQEVRWCSFGEAVTRAEPSLIPALVHLEEAWVSHEPEWRAMVEAMAAEPTGGDR